MSIKHLITVFTLVRGVAGVAELFLDASGVFTVHVCNNARACSTARSVSLTCELVRVKRSAWSTAFFTALSSSNAQLLQSIAFTLYTVSY